MNNIISIFTLFSLLVGVMLLGLWSNIHVYAQQSSSITSSPPKVSKPISEELKAKMCDPTNPDLKVVNTTEARICGIVKTVKPGLASAVPTPQSTSAESSSSPTQQTLVTTKPTTATTSPPKQQQIVNTKNIPRSSGSGTPIALLSHPTSGIAPQVAAVKHQQQPPVTLINSTAGINNTAGQNYTFAAISPAATSGQVVYLGYHGAATNPTHGNSGSKHDDSDNNNNHDSTRRVSDSSSKDDDGTSSAIKKKTSSTKSDEIDSTNAKSSSKDKKIHNGDSSSDSSSSSKKSTKSDDGSSKQDDDSSSATSSSHGENSFSSVIVKSFNPKHSTDSSSESSSIDDRIPSVIMKSFNFN
jgi:hypothetical protein